MVIPKSMFTLSQEIAIDISDSYHVLIIQSVIEHEEMDLYVYVKLDLFFKF